MEWLLVALAIVFISGIVKGVKEAGEKEKQGEETKARKERAEKARQAIMESGDKELIGKLLLMEASYQQQSSGGSISAGTAKGPSALGTAAAVAGGVIVADAVTTSMHQAALEEALADVQADLEAEVGALQASFGDIAGLDEIEDADFGLEL